MVEYGVNADLEKDLMKQVYGSGVQYTVLCLVSLQSPRTTIPTILLANSDRGRLSTCPGVPSRLRSCIAVASILPEFSQKR